MYKPIPDCVTIKKSEIHGLGLFAKLDIKEKINLGLTHIYDENFENNYIRTPLGGFFNHNSIDPNCIIVKEGKFLFLSTIEEIKAGEELTAKYTIYDPESIVKV
jgi:SET domain-containing protein